MATKQVVAASSERADGMVVLGEGFIEEYGDVAYGVSVVCSAAQSSVETCQPAVLCML